MHYPKGYLAIGVGFGAGAWFTYKALAQSAALRRAAWWPSARGRILESVLYHDAARKGTHFRVRYEFTVDRTRFESQTARLCGDWFWNNRQQAAFVARYQPDQVVEVFYDPLDPRRNCLDRTDRSGLAAMGVIAGAGTLLASLLVWLDWLDRHKTG